MASRLRPSVDRARRWAGLIALFAVATGLWLLMWTMLPTLLFGWEPIAISSSSMEPRIRPGDVVIAEPFVPPLDAALGSGAVVVFGGAVEGDRVTHRIVAATPSGAYVTKGDANPRPDSTPVEPWQIVGVGRVLVPMIGAPIAWVRNGEPWRLLLFLAAALAALWLAPAALAPMPARARPDARRLIPRPLRAAVVPALRHRRRKPAAVPRIAEGADRLLALAVAYRRRRKCFASGAFCGLSTVFIATWLVEDMAPHLGVLAMVGVLGLWWASRDLLGPAGGRRVPTVEDLAAAAVRRRRRRRLATAGATTMLAVVAGSWAQAGSMSRAAALLMVGGCAILLAHAVGAGGRPRSPGALVATATSRHLRSMFGIGTMIGLLVATQAFGVAEAVFARTTENAGNVLAAAASFPQTSLYLHDEPTPPVGDTASQRLLPMDETVPTAAVLYNYDVDRDVGPGLLLRESDQGLAEDRNSHRQLWLEAGPRTIDGKVQLEFWSAMTDFSTVDRGVVLAGLFECRNSGRNCTQIGASFLDRDPWDGSGTATWVRHTIDFGNVTWSVPANRSLVLELVVSNAADDDLRFAYDTDQYRSRLLLP